MTNAPITHKPGAGKTFTTQLLMLSLVRPNMLIFDRGDSYPGLVELYAGRAIGVNLDGGANWNPFQLAAEEKTAGKVIEKDPEQSGEDKKEKNGCL